MCTKLNHETVNYLLSRFGLILIVLSFLCGCSNEKPKTLFQKIDSEQSNVQFSNDLTEKEGIDVFRYRNFYNGAGVGIGDFNNDGLQDIYFVSNQKSNRLYINNGDFNFKDQTKKAGVGGSKPWSTGVTIADVNGDNWLDIYVSNSGILEGGNRENELFINNKDGTFTERADEFGLDDSGFTTHSAFLDYDNDGDLDLFVMNNSYRPVSSLPLKNIRNIPHHGGGDRFYENRDGKFVDVSEEVGIYSSVIAFGLSVTLTDVNRDGWTDIYISNDFFERDYLYINQQGQGFSEELEQRMDQISLASMGADGEDLNNDGWPEIFVTEMLPEKSERLKQVTSFESFKSFDLKKEQGFYNQFQRNTLQLNQTNGRFVEVGRYSEVDATDWSWGALIFDMNNNSQKEIFVTNGVYKDVTDQDFLEYFGSEENLRAARQGSEVHFEKFIDKMPSTPIPNYAFAMDSAFVFENKSAEWGLDTPSFSNGLSYGDLDNDGDLDLVVNNLNQQSFIYRNNSEAFNSNHYITINLQGNKKNTSAIGAAVTAYTGGKQITRHQYPSRGFQSSVEHLLVLGMGAATNIDSLHINWDHQRISKFYDVPVDTQLTISVSNAEVQQAAKESPNPIFKKISFNHRHQENNFNDFNNSALVFHMLSREGPPVVGTDLNKDGLEDFFIGGAAGTAGSLYMNQGDNNFQKLVVDSFQENKTKEEVGAAFFDADNDGDPDLYIVSGGNEVGSDISKFQDQLYINEGLKNGKPVFTTGNGLPRLFSSGSTVKPADFDQDGDLDLFVGSRSIPGEYGKSASSYLLENDGHGNFEDVTSKYVTGLKNIGMVTDAAWVDYDNDGDQDLFIVGDWMSVTLFENKGNFFQKQFDVKGLSGSKGWWKSITPVDVNSDGYMDFIAGNLGTNSMFKADDKQPVRLYINDFDRNNSLDHVYAFKKNEKFVPYHLKDNLAHQLSFIDAKFPKHEDYADKTMSDIFSKQQLDGSIKLSATQLSSVAIINNGDGTFELKKLPKEAQFSSIYDTEVEDFDNDGNMELLLVGNFSGTRPMEGFYDANHGLLLEITEDGSFLPVSNLKSGLWIRGDVRSAETIETESGKLLIIGKNNSKTELYAY